MVQVNPDFVDGILCELQKNFGSLGFEFHPFKTEWYNCFVQPSFKLDYDGDTLAFVVLSAPKMFEEAFVPFLRDRHNDVCSVKDPIDQCMVHHLSKIPKLFPECGVGVLHDFELHPNRRPRVVMQSAAHASGAAYFYSPHSVHLDFSQEPRKMYGVCIHPRYGGWFALRAVAIFENVRCPDLLRVPPPNVVPCPEDQTRLLRLYNFSWKDWTYRDIIGVHVRYSDTQVEYFSTPPGCRGRVIDKIIKGLDEVVEKDDV